MVSEIDLEFMEIMGDIRRKEAQAALWDSEEDAPEKAPGRESRLSPPPRSLLPLLIAIALVALLVYLAYLAGFFGTTEGQEGLWREAYWNNTEHLNKLDQLYDNATESLNEMTEDRDHWKEGAEGYMSDLESCRSELQRAKLAISEWEEKHWSTQLLLNRSLDGLESLKLDLARSEEEKSELRTLYLSLEEEHATLSEELAVLEAKLEEESADSSRLEDSLDECTRRCVQLQMALVVLGARLCKSEGEADMWLERFHALELDYRELLCELEISRIEVDEWRRLCREREAEISSVREDLESCRAGQRAMAIALEEALDREERLKRLYESARSRLEVVMRERDRWMSAYSELNSTLSLAIEEREHWRLLYRNLTLILVQLESERDHWKSLYQQQQSQLLQCATEIQYWKGQCDSAQSQLSATLVQVQILQEQLSQCQSEQEQWKELYEACQEELQEAQSQIEYWMNLYMGLANISLTIELGNANVVERQGGKPSVVEVDITACVSTTETPMLLLLEYWAEPVDCIWGYGSLQEDISTWSGLCKTFRIPMDFGTGVGPYRIIAQASLRPIHGYDEAELLGPE